MVDPPPRGQLSQRKSHGWLRVSQNDTMRSTKPQRLHWSEGHVLTPRPCRRQRKSHGWLRVSQNDTVCGDIVHTNLTEDIVESL